LISQPGPETIDDLLGLVIRRSLAGSFDRHEESLLARTSNEYPVAAWPAGQCGSRTPVTRYSRIKPIDLPAANSNEVVSVPVAAMLLGISKSHAYELIRRGELQGIHLGRRVVVPMRAVEGLLMSAKERSA
jgi:excisionase family DNA binding protein